MAHVCASPSDNETAAYGPASDPWDDREYDVNTKRAVFGLVLTQMSAKEGIKRFGDRARAAMLKELMQLNDMEVFRPFDAAAVDEEKTREVLRTSLRSVNLIKEKRDGRIKGRSCADGRPQREQFSKQETTSPTVSAEALFLSIMIDAYKGRDVATADVAGAYLNAIQPDYVTMKLEGEMIDIMCEANPAQIRNYVPERKKVPYRGTSQSTLRVRQECPTVV